MKNVALQSVEGVEIYPIISLILFASIFALVLIYVFRADKSFINKMAELPIEKEENTEEGGYNHV